MSHPKFTTPLCWIALAVAYASSAVAQNSHINQEGQTQMNDAAPIDDTAKREGPVHDAPPPRDLNRPPVVGSPDGAAAGPSEGENGREAPRENKNPE